MPSAIGGRASGQRCPSTNFNPGNADRKATDNSSSSRRPKKYIKRFFIAVIKKHELVIHATGVGT
jgi:hypothetical protein